MEWIDFFFITQSISVMEDYLPNPDTAYTSPAITLTLLLLYDCMKWKKLYLFVFSVINIAEQA